jgi:hypothetical protein
LRGTNEAIEKKLDEVMNGNITVNGVQYPVIPTGVDLDVFLQEYYDSLKGERD